MNEFNIFTRLLAVQQIAELIIADSRVDTDTRKAVAGLVEISKSYRKLAFELREWTPE